MSDITMECPKCGRSLKFDLEDVARERTVRCAGGHNVKLNDEGRGARRATDALDDLHKSIAKLNKTIKFKL